MFLLVDPKETGYPFELCWTTPQGDFQSQSKPSEEGKRYEQLIHKGRNQNGLELFKYSTKLKINSGLRSCQKLEFCHSLMNINKALFFPDIILGAGIQW